MRIESAAGLLLALGVLSAAGCSHVQPYPGGGTLAVEVDPAIRARVILVGDGGRPDPAVLAGVGVWNRVSADRTAVVFLGDNVYEDGLPEGPAEVEKAVLDQQIAATGAAHGIFVPGNHDWHGGRAGVGRQADYVERGGGRVRFRPADGCPGPALDESLDGVLLVLLDTQWLLQSSPDATGCGLGDDPGAGFAERVREVVAEVLNEGGDRLIVVAGHHPPRTHGPHGGFFDWRDHLFPLTRLVSWGWLPLPLVGSVYPLGRRALAHDQDAYSRRYRTAQALLGEAFSGYTGTGPLIFAGGHDHSLQVLGPQEPWDYVLVSGSASVGKLTSVTHGPGTLFAHLAHGFMVLDVYADGRVLLRVMQAGRGSATFTRWLRSE